MDADVQALFEESLSRFNRERYAPAQWAEYGRCAEGFSPQVWSEMERLGWFELLSPDEDGATAPLAHLLPLFKAAGEALWREPIATVFGEAVAAVAASENAERRSGLFAGLVKAARPLGFAHREPGDGWSRSALDTCARKAGTRYLLKGCKTMVAGDGACAAFVVSAVVADVADTALFLVDAHAPGLTVQRYRTIDDRMAADLRFVDTPADLLCSSGPVLRRAQARGAILAAAESVGIMRGAIDATREHLRQRQQFGQSLLHFQALQHRLVEMLMRMHESAALVDAAAEAFDDDAPALERQLLVLRAQLAGALRHITREAVQLHGGMGVTEELRIGRYYKRALMLDSLYGTSEWALDALAQA